MADIELKQTHQQARRVLTVQDGVLAPRLNEKGKPISYIGNVIRTTKYTYWNFFPKNLFEQLRRPANLYFVLIAILQSIQEVSISQGKPTILLPLTFVLVVSMVKDGFEDAKRHAADKKENDRRYHVREKQGEEFKDVMSQDIVVGDIVKVNDDEFFPADLLLVTSGLEGGGYCYVETANLDGETNLKIKTVPEPCQELRSKKQLASLSMVLACDEPNGEIDRWGGHITMDKGNKEALLGPDNLLLRGSKLRNTGFIYGMVVYSGEDTKLRKNSSSRGRARIKRSGVELMMNRLVLFMFIFQFIVCLAGGIGCGVWQLVHKDHDAYLAFPRSPAIAGITRFFTWFIIFAGFVPISLVVSMEMVKFWQGLFIGMDLDMAHKLGDELQFARAQTSGLNEELGLVQYILSDKTGTLTCNSMDFRKTLIGHCQYGTGDTDISRSARQRESFVKRDDDEDEDDGKSEVLPHINFNAREQLQAVINGTEPNCTVPDVCGRSQQYYAAEYMRCLALANTVFPATENGVTLLKASSPDEECLVEFAKFVGYDLTYKNQSDVRITVTTDKGSVTEEYVELAVLDFTSKRKRMSSILQRPDGRIVVYTKGADSFVELLLKGYGKPEFDKEQPTWKFTLAQLEKFGEQGLRTLLLASADVDRDWWFGENGWLKRWNEARAAFAVEGPAERDHHKGGCQAACRRCALEEAVELSAGLRVIGATAIEDKLQDDVPASIKDFLDGGMCVWVLTGDKLETAINIGMACNLLESSMERKGNLLRIEAEEIGLVEKEIDKHVEHMAKHISSKSTAAVGLVLTSQALSCLMNANRPDLVQKFLQVATSCKSVVGCRMQPNQKALIVRLVKDAKKVTTLAVGDGANDEQMIREAHVGVGIRGVEGTAAVRAADYAISQFAFMRKLLFVHGRLNNRRVVNLICYIFYKNSLLCFVFLWFGFISGFSGQSLFLEWAYQLWNVAFSSIPIFVFAVFDYDIDPDTLLANPHIYKLSQHGELFNIKVFVQWILFALLHSVIIFVFSMLAYDDVSFDSSGQSSGLWSMGIVIYTGVTIVSNLKLGLVMASWTWLHHLLLWGTIVVYFVCMIILNADPVFATAGADYYFEVFRLLGTPKYWFTVIIMIIASLFMDYTVQGLEALDLLGKRVRPIIISPLLRKSKSQAQSRVPMLESVPSSDAEDQVGALPTTPRSNTSVRGRTDSIMRRQNTGFDFDFTPGEPKQGTRRQTLEK